MEKIEGKEQWGSRDRASSVERLCVYATYIFASFPAVIEFVGYGTFSTYWLASGERSFAVLLGSIILFSLLREWDQKFYSHHEGANERPAQPVRWFIFRVSWLVWGSVTILLLILAWGGNRPFFLKRDASFGILWRSENSR